MAYYGSRRNSNRYYGNQRYGRKTTGKKNKYSTAEQIAFKMGQEQKVSESLARNKNSRVYESYCKGYNGVPKADKSKPLF